MVGVRWIPGGRSPVVPARVGRWCVQRNGEDDERVLFLDNFRAAATGHDPAEFGANLPVEPGHRIGAEQNLAGATVDQGEVRSEGFLQQFQRIGNAQAELIGRGKRAGGGDFLKDFCHDRSGLRRRVSTTFVPG